jgi:glycosyltransferase involved in cell wall biosynthesis
MILVIIPCFNHGEFLPAAVESVLSTRRNDIEMVIDNGSTDPRTHSEIDKLNARGIKVIRQENKGLGAARNAGVLASEGRYIFPLDADDHLRPDLLDLGIKIIDSQPEIGVIYGDALCFGSRNDRWRVRPFDGNRLLDWNFIHASALYRRLIWEQSGGYDTGMPVQGLEDWDFWLGTYELGWRFEYVAEAFFEYRQAEQSIRTVGFEDQIRKFEAKKHGMLYQQTWLSELNEQQSIKWAMRHLVKLVECRLNAKFNEKKPASLGGHECESSKSQRHHS